MLWHRCAPNEHDCKCNGGGNSRQKHKVESFAAVNVLLGITLHILRELLMYIPDKLCRLLQFCMMRLTQRGGHYPIPLPPWWVVCNQAMKLDNEFPYPISLRYILRSKRKKLGIDLLQPFSCVPRLTAHRVQCFDGEGIGSAVAKRTKSRDFGRRSGRFVAGIRHSVMVGAVVAVIPNV